MTDRWAVVSRVKVSCQACGRVRICVRGDLYSGWTFFACCACVSDMALAAAAVITGADKCEK